MSALIWLAVMVAGMSFTHRAIRMQQLRYSDRRRPPRPWWSW